MNTHEIIQRYKCPVHIAKRLDARPQDILIGSVITYDKNDPRIQELLESHPGSYVHSYFDHSEYRILLKETQEQTDTRIRKSIKKLLRKNKVQKKTQIKEVESDFTYDGHMNTQVLKDMIRLEPT